MDFWDGKERHASPYTKYRTVPGWSSSSHIYPSKTSAAPSPQSRAEYQGWMGEPSNWTVPGSRTGGTMRDYVNWTDIAPSSNCPPDNLLYTQEIATTHGGQERGLDRQRVLLDRDRERLVQRGELMNKWQPCSSSLHRREKEKLSVNSFRELEAWANRYYHSLPRQRNLQAKTWNITQNVTENERIFRSASRLFSQEPAQRPLANTSAPQNQEKCNLNNRLRAQLEAWKAQQLPSYASTKQSPSRRNTILSPSFSHPPNYMSPPPYCGPENSDIQQVPGQSTAKASAEHVLEYHVESRPVTAAFPVRRRSEQSFAPLTERRQHPSSDGIPRTLTYRDKDQARKQQMLLNTLAESLTAQQAVEKQEADTTQQSSHQISEKNHMSYVDDARLMQSKPKKRRGGETVFCLVSRMGELAGLSSSPDEPLKSHSLRLLNIPTPRDVADVDKEICEKQESQETVTLADEVDSESLISHKVEENTPERPKGECQDKATKQILTGLEVANKERLQREICETFLAKHTEKQSFQTSKEDQDPKITVLHKEEEHFDSCTSFKNLLSPQMPENLEIPQSNQTTVKFPLWKEPKLHYTSDILPKKNETDQDISNVGQNEEPVDVPSKHPEIRNSINTIKDKNRGLVVIDATCVVVKVEFIFPPEKEHVQYVCSRSSDSYEHSPESLNLQVQHFGHNDHDTSGPTEKDLPANNSHELCVQILNQDIEDLRNTSPVHVSGDVVLKDLSQIPSEVISENETLKERAERILGITLLNSNDKGHTLDELPQVFQTEDDVQMVQEELEGASEAKDDVGSRVGINQLTGVGSSDNLKTLTKEIVKDVPTLMTKELKESEINPVNALKTIQTYNVITEEVTKQDNESTSEDNEETFATQHMEAKSSANTGSGTGTTILQLTDSSESKVSESLSNDTSSSNDLLPSHLDDLDVENPTESFLQEVSPRESNPMCETGDVYNTCPILPAELVDENSESFGQEGTTSEGILSNDLQNLCPTLLQELHEEGDSFIETGGRNNNNLYPVLPGSYGENINKSIAQEGGSTESKPNTTDDLCNPCPAVLETHIENACKLYAQENAPHLSDENNAIKNICSSLGGNSAKGTSEPLFSQGGTLPDAETYDLHKYCPSILRNSVEDTTGLFSQEAPSSSFTSNTFGEKYARECLLLDETDGAWTFCPDFIDDHMENSCQRFDQECSVNGDNKSSKAEDIVSSSVEDSSDQENKPEEGSQSIEQVDASTLLVLVNDSSNPFGKEGGLMEGNLSDKADRTGNPVFCKNSEQHESQLVTGQKQSFQDFLEKTDCIQNPFQPLLGSFEEDTFELSCKETIPINRCKEVSLLNETVDIVDLCSASFVGDVGGSHELPDKKDTEDHRDNGDILLPNLRELHNPTLHIQESTPLLPLKPLSPCSLLAPSLFEAFCSSQNSEAEPELSSLLSSDYYAKASPLPTSDLLDQSQPLESLSQTSSIYSTVWPPGSSPLTKCKKKQYPKSLWDAVNRIRKHTAPDSENEDEDGGELWEQLENLEVEDHSSTDTEVQTQDTALGEGCMGGMIEPFDGNENLSVLSDSYLVDGITREDKVLITVEGGQAEEDTLSSSSLESHDSNDTVIEGKGNEVSDKENNRNNEELHMECHLIDKNKGISNEELNLSSMEDNDCLISEVFKEKQ